MRTVQPSLWMLWDRDGGKITRLFPFPQIKAVKELWIQYTDKQVSEKESLHTRSGLQAGSRFSSAMCLGCERKETELPLLRAAAPSGVRREQEQQSISGYFSAVCLVCKTLNCFQPAIPPPRASARLHQAPQTEGCCWRKSSDPHWAAWEGHSLPVWKKKELKIKSNLKKPCLGSELNPTVCGR